jgi:hypothetical protein
MTFLALDVGDETHATGIVFIGGVVKTLLMGLIHLLFLKRHARSRAQGPGKGRTGCSPAGERRQTERAQKSRARAHRLHDMHHAGAKATKWH